MAQTEVIAGVMDERGVSARNIPEEPETDPEDFDTVRRSWRYFRVKGFARFRRHRDPSGGYCSRTWPSAHAWCIMDLKEQKIIHKFDQNCQQCEGMGLPDFDEKALERMADYAVESYLRKSGRLLPRQHEPLDMSDLADALEDNGPPHDEQRCEVCRRLGRSCWKRLAGALEDNGPRMMSKDVKCVGDWVVAVGRPSTAEPGHCNFFCYMYSTGS